MGCPHREMRTHVPLRLAVRAVTVGLLLYYACFLAVVKFPQGVRTLTLSRGQPDPLCPREFFYSVDPCVDGALAHLFAPVTFPLESSEVWQHAPPQEHGWIGGLVGWLYIWSVLSETGVVWLVAPVVILLFADSVLGYVARHKRHCTA